MGGISNWFIWQCFSSGKDSDESPATIAAFLELCKINFQKIHNVTNCISVFGLLVAVKFSLLVFMQKFAIDAFREKQTKRVSKI